MEYGMVHRIPKGLNKGDSYMFETFDVARTGDKRQYYTLYRLFESCVVGYFFVRHYQFKQNLSHNKVDAVRKAKKIAKGAYIAFFETPKAEYHKFEAFDLQWKVGKKCYYAIVEQSFWSEWKKRKEEIKAAGFWVSRNKQTGDWYVFFRRERGAE